MSEDAYVREFGFREFEGIRSGRLYRVFAIAEFNLKEAIKRSGFIKLLLILMVFFLIIQTILAYIISLISALQPGGVTGNDLFRKLYAESILGMISLTNRIDVPPDIWTGLLSILPLTTVGNSFAFVLLLSLISGGLISDDKLNRATEAYFSRVSRFEYIFGKLLSLILFAVLIVTLPACMQYFLLSQGLETNILANLDLLGWALGITILSSTILSIFSLSISSLTKRRTLATLLFFILAIVLSTLPTAFGMRSDNIALVLDFVGCIALFGTMTLRFSSIRVNGRSVDLFDGDGLEAGLVLGVIGLVILLAVFILVTNIIRRDA